MKRIFILNCFLSLFIYTSCTTQEHKKEMETKFLVTSPVQRDTFIFKEYVSQIQSINHIEIRSQERGFLQTIFVDEGQFLKKGQLMFKIMPLIYQAEVAKAKAEMNFAEIEYKNTKSLADNNVVSTNELALAKATLDKAKAELALAEAHLGFTEIRAPFDGIMDRFQKRIGSLIEEGELLTTLSDNSRMWVYFNVPEAEYLDYVKKPKSESTKNVLLKMANNEHFDVPGVVETIEADFNNETGNIAFRATFPNPKGLLRHGGTGNILMPINLKNAIIIPQRATFDVLDKKFVYIVDKNNLLKAKEIIVEQELPHLYVVASGLRVNDKILAEGLGKVKNNVKISYEFVSFAKELAELNNLHAE